MKEKYRYQLQTTAAAAEATGSPMYTHWSVASDKIYKNVKTFKKAKSIYALMPKGSRMVDKKKKLYWMKGAV